MCEKCGVVNVNGHVGGCCAGSRRRRRPPARGLSKFQVDTFERRLQFAYRLMDLDGDGSLDKFELNAAMKARRDRRLIRAQLKVLTEGNTCFFIGCERLEHRRVKAPLIVVV